MKNQTYSIFTYEYKTPLFKQFTTHFNNFLAAEAKGDEDLCYQIEMAIKAVYGAMSDESNRKTVASLMKKEPLTKTKWVHKTKKEEKAEEDADEFE